MNKILKVLMVLAFVATASFAQNTNVGAHAAINYGTVTGDDTEDVPWGVGFNAGVAAKFGLIPMLDLAPELGVGMRRQSNDEGTWTTWAIEIPVLLRVNIMPQLFFEVGPTVAFLLSSEMESEAVDEFTGIEMKMTIDLASSEVDVLQTFEFGLAAGVGFSVMPKLDVNFRFAYGLTSITDEDKLGKACNLQLQLGATYWFL